MSTLIAILGGVGLFLLGMTVMTDGLKAMAGSALRSVLGKAAATPVSGAFWGAMVTLLVQSSSAVTMTTIGLVSAGLLTFQQGLGLVMGANVGTTGTGWLVALIGVRVSLSAYALPAIFLGAILRLLGKGRVSSAGGAIAGFALVLYGLTTLQQGMSGLAEVLQPSDLPAVLGEAGVGWLEGTGGVLLLVLTGLVMTAVMQSSTAAIAVTIASFYAGALSVEQGAALIIGQNIGTATSSALAAIGASTTAKRLALAYILFKLIAAAIAIALFPLTSPLMRRLSGSIDGTTLLAAYHTAYNVVGVCVLLPATHWFTRVVERILPSKETSLERTLDDSALAHPIVAIEAARRVVADVLGNVTMLVSARLSGKAAHDDSRDADAAASALSEVREFLSGLREPPESDVERDRLTHTLHALDHAARLVENLRSQFPAQAELAEGAPDVVALCDEIMQAATRVADAIAAETALSERAAPIGWGVPEALAQPLALMESRAARMEAVQRDYRTRTLAGVAPGLLTASDALARIDASRALYRIAFHAWRSVEHLLGQGGAHELARGP